jgi:transposase
MKYNQNQKISQITEKTLVVGVDIAKKVHYARAFDWRGIEYGAVIHFKANGSGFEEFLKWMENIREKYGMIKVIIGLEPTGHYWYTFAQAVLEKRILVVQVNPYHVKKSKELDDNNPSKSDRKDPKTIAMLVKDGRYQIPYIPKGIYAELRNINNLREEFLKKIWSVKNKIIRWIDMYFPNFFKVFGNWEGKTALKTLEKFGLPENIVKASAEEVLSIWREDVKRGVGIKRAEKLLEEAKASVGVREGLISAKYHMTLLLQEYRELRRVLDEIEEKMETLVLEIPGAMNIIEMKGIGIKTVAGFFAEVGDITRFNHPKQIIKLAGLNLRENSSGSHKGETTITKRGRSRLRALLFRAILPLAGKNKEFNALHHYYISRKGNPLKKMQSLIALCHKLIRIMYTLVSKGVKYDPIVMMNDIRRPEIKQAA